MKRLFSTKVSEGVFSFAMLILRLGAGGILVGKYGWDKLTHFSSKASHFADPFGIGSMPSFAMVVFAEFFCAIFIMLGLFTRLACLSVIVAMSVALFYAHHGDVLGLGSNAALFLTCSLTLLFAGPGKVSFDRFIGK